MKIGFDISQLAHFGGVATYTKNLTQELCQIKGLEMVFFYSSLRNKYCGVLPNVKSFLLPPSLFEILFNRLRIIPIENFIGQVDIFHSSDWVQPPTRAKKVTTYHDVIPLKYPKWSHPKIIGVHKRRLKLVEKEIDMVITVSEATKQDLLEISDLPEEKIVVIYEAAGDNFKPQPEKSVEEFRQKLKLPKKFILSISGVGERRNLDRVRDACKGYELIIAGETIPRVFDEDLPLLYSAAEVLLYPSLYEGFGLPILEAMACGTPVITSNVSSMPEVGGKAVIYVDPLNGSDITDKVKLVMGDKRLREEMIEKSFDQSKKFSWEKCARETAEVYKDLLRLR